MDKENQTEDKARDKEWLNKLREINEKSNLLFDEKADIFQKTIEDAKAAGVPLEKLIKFLKELKNHRLDN